MNQLMANLDDFMQEHEARDLISDSCDVWPICGAGIGLIGGVVAPLLGVLLTLASWLGGHIGSSPLLHKLGTICFFLTVPLFIFGAYCLDVLEKRGWKFGGRG